MRIRGESGASLGLLACLWLCACGGDSGRDDNFGDAGDGGSDAGDDGSGDDGGSGGDTGSSGDTGDSDGSGDGVKYDVGGDPDGGPDEGCEKIDFLFVIDNSRSMDTAQDNLATSFPGFIQTIQQEVQGQDHHIMVVDSDDDPTWICEPSVHQGDPVWPNNLPEYEQCPATDDWMDACGGYVCGASMNILDDGDKTLGCGVVRPYGGKASNIDCGVDGGKRYMTETQTDLEGTFSCVARVGVSGYILEAPVSSLRAAVSDPFNASGGCNGGFLRDDAILVVVMISDDGPYLEGPDEVMPGVNGTPQQWYDEIVAAKNGDPSAIVFLGILATPDGANHWPCWHGDSPNSIADRFIELVNLFGPTGLLGDTCAPDYTPYFEDAVGLVDQACDEFVPPG